MFGRRICQGGKRRRQKDKKNEPQGPIMLAGRGMGHCEPPGVCLSQRIRLENSRKTHPVLSILSVLTTEGEQELAVPNRYSGFFSPRKGALQERTRS